MLWNSLTVPDWLRGLSSQELLSRFKGPWSRLAASLSVLLLMILLMAECSRYYEAPVESSAMRQAEAEAYITSNFLMLRLFQFYYLPQTQVRPDCQDCAR